jgi:N-acetylglutamate synthase-like GNAT family acetyltransferase
VAELTGLAVLPDVAGTGVGARLLAEFETWAIDAGAWRLKVTSGDHRPDAHAFYERRGYAHSGIRLHKLIRDEPPSEAQRASLSPSAPPRARSGRRAPRASRR